MAEENNHMLTLPCALHVANTLCKDICKINRIKSIVKNCALVNYFVSSHVWFALANEWAAKRDKKYSFQSLVETRWYSMVKVCLSIGYYKAFLKDAVTKCGTREELPQIREEILQNITDRHFVDNGDLIGELEKFSTNLADIILQFLKLHLYFKQTRPTRCSESVCGRLSLSIVESLQTIFYE